MPIACKTECVQPHFLPSYTYSGDAHQATHHIADLDPHDDGRALRNSYTLAPDRTAWPAGSKPYSMAPSLQGREELGTRALIDALDVVHVLASALTGTLGCNALRAPLVLDLSMCNGIYKSNEKHGNSRTGCPCTGVSTAWPHTSSFEHWVVARQAASTPCLGSTGSSSSMVDVSLPRREEGRGEERIRRWLRYRTVDL